MGKKTIIADLRKKIEEKEKELGDTFEAKYNAGCSLLLDKYTPYDIPTIRKKDTLIGLAGKLLRLKTDITKGAEFLGEEIKPAINGFTIDEWLEDIKTRMGVITFIEKKKQIEAWKIKLNALLTEEEWREIEIKKLQAELE